MDRKLRIAVIKTLSYAAVFEYPLALPELHRYLAGIKVDLRKLSQLVSLMPEVNRCGKFLFLRGHHTFVQKRIKRQQVSKRHFSDYQRFINWLGRIPTVRFIGITGSLAMSNSTEFSDIDLFFITAKNTLWLTRIVVTAVLFLTQKKRSRAVSFASHKVCTNMWLSEDALSLSKRNFFVAHEIAQIKVIVNKDLIYERFMQENIWVQKYLPQVKISGAANHCSLSISGIVSYIMVPLENIAFIVQLVYMSKNRTSEKVTRKSAFFHPHDMTSGVLKKYRKIFTLALKQHDIPRSKLNKIKPIYSSNYSGILT